VKNQHTLIIIAGPTAIGKTALSIELAKSFQTEIISADSRQFYKEISIGTAKPSQLEMNGVVHHFIDSHSISEDYNVGKFETDVLSLLEILFQKHSVIIMVGGSGLYIDAVCKGFDNLPLANQEIRNEILAIKTEKGIEGLQKLLLKLDSVTYNTIDIHNTQRLSRAIEVCLSTGKPYSQLITGKKKDRNFNIIKIGLNTSREKLYKKINARVDIMLQEGLLEEVKSVINHKTTNALQTVGYKELIDYLEGKTDFKTAIELIKQHTRNFAKRQITWFKRDEQIHWFEPSEKKQINIFIQEELNKLNN